MLGTKSWQLLSELSELSINIPSCLRSHPPPTWVHLFHQVFTNMVISTNLGQFNQNLENLGEGSPSVPFPCLRARLEMPEMVSGCKNHGCHWVYRHEVSTMDLCGFINCMRYHLSLMPASAPGASVTLSRAPGGHRCFQAKM